MDDQIIDLAAWADEKKREQETFFSVWGGEGERTRLALPVWRAVYLLSGERGGVVWWEAEGDEEVLHPFLVLDLTADPARTDFDATLPGHFEGMDPPAVEVVGDTMGILLGRKDGRDWFLVVAGEGVGEEDPEKRAREDVLFLAGECSGLLIHRDLAREADRTPPPP